MSNRYSKSEETLLEALKVIPLGSQTIGKSLRVFPYGVSPYFVNSASGSYTWDIDGNKYIDMINSLYSVILGHNDEHVMQAVLAQLNKGVNFSLSSVLELTLARKVIELVPCAEMVKFGKNGSDVTSLAVRLARAYTNKQHIFVCGYHGWQDWFVSSNKVLGLGVPSHEQAFVHAFQYNDIDQLAALFTKFEGNIAGVIMEPLPFEFPNNGYLQKVRQLCDISNAILIFDEMVTGFRVSLGGAQEYFNVTPDLACFGKAIANGFPLSVLAGREKIMQTLDRVFYTLTHGGETLSLAAAIAVLNKLEDENVLKRICFFGDKFKMGLQKIINKHNLCNIMRLRGHPTIFILEFCDFEKYDKEQLRTWYMQEILKHSVLCFGIHSFTYSHVNDIDIQVLLDIYDHIFNELSNILYQGKALKLNIKTTELIDKLQNKAYV